MLFTSPFENVPLPPGQTTWDALERHARGAAAHDPVFICSVSDRVVTFAQMFAHAERICAGLHAAVSGRAMYVPLGALEVKTLTRVDTRWL